MKNYIIIPLLAAMAIVACRNSNTQNNIKTLADVEEVTTTDATNISSQSKEIARKETANTKKKTIVENYDLENNLEQWVNRANSTSNGIAGIDVELSQLFENMWLWEDTTYTVRQDFAVNRLLYHLNNPLTFTEDMPLLSAQMNIISTDDGLYKFYSWSKPGGSMTVDYLNFIQYRKPDGEVIWMPYRNWTDGWNDGVVDVWQTEIKGETYYVVKLYSFREYKMEIISIDPEQSQSARGPVGYSNSITSHSEFYPSDIYYSEIPLKDYGCPLKVSNTAYVCGKDGNRGMDFVFYPDTQTVTIVKIPSYKDSYMVTVSQWQLDIPE